MLLDQGREVFVTRKVSLKTVNSVVDNQVSRGCIVTRKLEIDNDTRFAGMIDAKSVS